MSEPESGAAELPSEDLPLSVMARDIIRERIIRGQYAQGTRLPEAKLAADLAVSRIPLRAAIPQLEVDGFVRTLPRRSAIVFQWTEKAVHELFDVRLAIEVLAARHAARRAAQGADVEQLRAAISRSEQSISDGDQYGIATTSTQIHQEIVSLADNELLSTLMGAVAGRIQWLFYLTSQRDQDIACQEHQDLCEVIASGNEDLAQAVAFAHIESGRSVSVTNILGPTP
ncbi:MAG TPA: GntR family transcriptional regulator [Microlunatus sp.]